MVKKNGVMLLMLLMVCAGCGRSKNDMLRGAAISGTHLVPTRP
ncbi:hypothetical protein AGMMS49532_02600 [Endomicrobiia bacterium]|nr:hypothetical protein AGMMS49532_02600 [Endomicrobiia bacterium]GMO54827.1 MAG: hypothetical protein Ta2C_08650 [Candidatus Endomicrobium trichonymphae]